MNRLRAFISVALLHSLSAKAGPGSWLCIPYLICWGALVFPLSFTYTPYDLSSLLGFSGVQTFSIYIANLMSPVTASYGAVAAAGVISIVPPAILLTIIRRDLERIWGAG